MGKMTPWCIWLNECVDITFLTETYWEANKITIVMINIIAIIISIHTHYDLPMIKLIVAVSFVFLFRAFERQALHAGYTQDNRC